MYKNKHCNSEPIIKKIIIFHFFEFWRWDSSGMGIKLMKFSWFILWDGTSGNIVWIGAEGLTGGALNTNDSGGGMKLVSYKNYK